MEATAPQAAICDANVLIDYVEADDDLFRELVRYWGSVYVPDMVLREVRALSISRAESLGLTIIDTPLELPPSPRLSFQDRSCLYFTIEKKWVCIANDVRLRTECESRGGRVVWGLEMLVLMYRAGQLTQGRALDCGTAIWRSNPTITKSILTTFREHVLGINGLDQGPSD